MKHCFIYLFFCASSLQAAVDLIGFYGPDWGAFTQEFNIQEASEAWGENISVDYYVLNSGDTDSAGYTVEFFISQDAVIGDAGDQSLGSVARAGTSSLTFDGATQILTLPDETWVGGTGTFYIGMVVDSLNQVAETDETNNSNVRIGADSDTLTVTVPKPDLIGFLGPDWGAFTEQFNVQQGSQAWGQAVNVDFYILNTGNKASGAFDVHFYLSADTTFGDAGDYDLGFSSFTGIARNTFDGGAGIAITLPPESWVGGTGTYYLGMVIDSTNTVDELNEANNSGQKLAADYDSLTVTVPKADLLGFYGPDWGAFTEQFDISLEGSWGETVSLDFHVVNSGTKASGPFDVHLYMSTDTTFGDVGDHDMGTYSFSDIAANSFDGVLGANATLPPDSWVGGTGTFYMGMVVDSTGAVDELNEANNSGVKLNADYDSIEIVVPADLAYYQDVPGGYIFDIQETDLLWGGAVNLKYFVGNYTDTDAGPFKVRFFLSEDNVIDGSASDRLWATLNVAGLAGNSSTGSIDGGNNPIYIAAPALPAVNPFGNANTDFYIGMLIDSDAEVFEGDESNNSSQGLARDLDGIIKIRTTYGNWEYEKTLTTPGRLNDSDGDGYTNEYEYFFGMDPNNPSNPRAAKASIASGYPAIEYSYRNDGSVNSYLVEASADLADWTSIPPEDPLLELNYTVLDGGPTDNLDNTSTVRVRYNTDLNTLPSGRLFMRVKAEE